MKLTLDWLKAHLETDATLDEITDQLTMLGLEVEEVIDRGAALAPFTVAYVEAAEQHPNADRLRVCKVNTGSEVLDVVCGAPNARAGMKGVFAPIGSVIPGTGITLEKRAIRGVTGFGMLCSEREMGISDEHEGIIELADDAPIGAPFAPLSGLDDPIIDIAITPDRGDCLGVLGIARDLAATGIGSLITGPVEPVPGSFKSPVGALLDFDAETADACPLFVGRMIRGLRNGPSPAWLQRRLTAIGLRPISALVDITNFVTYDRARPLHVFDVDSLAGGIHVRLAHPGEALAALDDKSYDLDPDMTVIADDDGPVALAGVIGGTATGCTADTTAVFIESAYFDPIRTATTGRRLQIDSDARYRFERGVDADFMALGEQIASRLILELCGGEASEVVIAGAKPETARHLPFDPARVAALGGVDIAEDVSHEILSGLGFTLAKGGVTTPTWRPDIEVESDVVEEVLRIHGFDNIDAVSLPRDHGVAAPVLTLAQRRVRWTKRALAARGLVEAVTWSFISEPQAALFGGGDASLRLANPISSELTDMRPSLLPGLMAAVARNIDRGFDDLALFEAGHVYSGLEAGDQAMVATAVRRGRSGSRHWLEPPRPVDAYDAKADALAVIAACGGPVDKAQFTADAPAWFHPGRSGSIHLGPKVLAHFGELHPRVLAALDVAGPLVGCEVFLGAIPEGKVKPGRAKPPLKLSPFQTVKRDFAFVVDDEIRAGDLLRAARGADKQLIDQVAVFDSFSGAALGAGKKSIAITVTLQPIDRTMTDADIEAVSKNIVAAVEKATGGTLRA